MPISAAGSSLVVVVELDQLGLELGVEEDRLGRGDQSCIRFLSSSSAELVGITVEDVDEGFAVISMSSRSRTCRLSAGESIGVRGLRGQPAPRVRPRALSRSPS